MLAGTGTVGATQISAGGIFAPGAPGLPGTSMTVSGNLVFQSDAIYLVEANPTSDGFRLIVSPHFVTRSFQGVWLYSTRRQQFWP